MKPFRVLSVDGGGIRGLYTAVVLHGIAERIARSNYAQTERLDVGMAFDMIVGTSTGAILATALAAGVALEDVIALYKTKASAIFSDPTPVSKWALRCWIYRNRNRAANTPEALREALTSVLGEQTIAEMYERRKIALCVPTIDVETQKAWVFKTPHQNRLQRDLHYKLVDVCMSSSAAPVVFPVNKAPKPNDPAGTINWFVDGGLWANNPVLVAMIEALSTAPPNSPIELISVSTCPPFLASSVKTENYNRGVMNWNGGIKIVEVALDAQSSAYDSMAKMLAAQLNNRVTYMRLTDPPVGPDEARELRLDNPSAECLAVLATLGSRAIDLNISEATAGEKPKALLTDIFKNLPNLPPPPPAVASEGEPDV